MNLFAKNADTTVTDPVCGMDVVPSTTQISAEIDGETYFFCADGCRKSFVANPKKYLSPAPPKKRVYGGVIWKGWRRPPAGRP